MNECIVEDDTSKKLRSWGAFCDVAGVITFSVSLILGLIVALFYSFILLFAIIAAGLLIWLLLHITALQLQVAADIADSTRITSNIAIYNCVRPDDKVFCDKCGAEITPPGSTFCSNCGNKVEEKTAPEA